MGNKKSKVAVPGNVLPPIVKDEDVPSNVDSPAPPSDSELLARKEADQSPPLPDANPVDRETIKALASEDPILSHLLDRITSMETLIVRMAHNSGTGHALILKAGLTPYNPTKDDMSKFRPMVSGG